ncbi:unnamed protein product [Aphanomyces euteiches]|uniref:Uncharacterized protein n=1 Tax=Aphanomyces euteiches TaxID=100861 RepID=A0A6G0XY01_9STRA|nr:hypothetical protein Ae201684_000436 [Aphanomyces euteiches]KAH9091621.1 hypothetical protein Ae201684P_011165 [Aphanomyces euteiches]KAH9092125.1 hypothetical protein LEN26_018684 [Aphanomyces euteiches]KAH9107361.1 hypothetical protein AeMF1_017302 [Aphanomyces euteiches]KAH9156289.1 hypothetical protein AeRB84_001786 [Aphanomyces euteiches]
MGAVTKYPYPKNVWSPAGGWWNEPKNWKNRTAILAGVMVALIVPMASFASKNATTFSHATKKSDDE